MHAPLTDSHDNAMTNDPWASHASHPNGAASCYESSASSRWNAVAGRYDNQATEPPGSLSWVAKMDLGIGADFSMANVGVKDPRANNSIRACI